MEYGFNTEHARKYGVEEAIILKNICFWIRKNKVNKNHFYEGRFWTYNSIKAWTELFPFWTFKQVRRILDSLVAKKVIKKGNFNEKRSDNTTWYALVDESMLELEDPDNTSNSGSEITTSGTACPNGQAACPNGQVQLPKWASPVAQMGKGNNTDNKPDNKPDHKHEPSAELLRSKIDECHKRGFKMQVLLNKFKKTQRDRKALYDIPNQVYIAVCDEFLGRKNTLNGDAWPYFLRVLEHQASTYFAGREMDKKDHTVNSALIGSILKEMTK